MLASRDYYAHRHGARRPSQDIEGLRGIAVAEFTRLEKQGLFQWHLGYDCVDDGYVAGRSSGTDPEAYARWKLGRDLWPFDEKLYWLDEDWTFTVLEFLYDHAAKPTSSRYHEYFSCGIHVQTADEAAGKELLRNSINRYLPEYGSGFEMQANGEIWSVAPTGLERRQPLTTGRDEIDTRVTHSIKTFRRHGATEEDKRDAIRNLADILEHLRNEGGTGLPKGDEDRLFEIANKFGIRHHSTKQRTEYDTNIWLDWIYYSFLNAISLVSELLDRQTQSSIGDDESSDLPFE